MLQEWFADEVEEASLFDGTTYINLLLIGLLAFFTIETEMKDDEYHAYDEISRYELSDIREVVDDPEDEEYMTTFIDFHFEDDDFEDEDDTDEDEYEIDNEMSDLSQEKRQHTDYAYEGEVSDDEEGHWENDRNVYGV